MLLHESLSLARELGDRPVIAESLLGLGLACWQQGEFEAAGTQLEESLAISRELGDQYMIAGLCNNLSLVTRERGDYEGMRSLVEESLRIARAVGDRRLTGMPLGGLGILHMLQGDYPKALAYYEESLAVGQEVGDPRAVAATNGLMGVLARYQRDLVTARARYAESLRIAHALGDRMRLQDALTGLGCVEIMSGETSGQTEEAAARWLCRGTRLLGAVEALRAATGRVIWAHDRADYERCVAVARAGLGEAAFAAAWAEGRALSLEAAVAYALAAGEDGS
jgi:tetratricopeptide (TPR) repeat protein